MYFQMGFLDILDILVGDPTPQAPKKVVDLFQCPSFSSIPWNRTFRTGPPGQDKPFKDIEMKG